MMNGQHDTDSEGRPLVVGSTHKHLAALERRLDYLETNLAGGKGSEGSRQFQEAEVRALRAAIIALTYHRSVIQRFDEPVGLLREMVDAYEGPPQAEGRLRAAVGRAKAVLEEFDVLMQQQQRN